MGGNNFGNRAAPDLTKDQLGDPHRVGPSPTPSCRQAPHYPPRGPYLSPKSAVALQSLAGNRAVQRLLVEGHPSTRATPIGISVQRIEVKDHGAAETKKWYSTQIEATGVKEIIPALVASMSPDSGVYLSDDISDWQQWMSIGTGKAQQVHRLVVPNKAALQLAPDKLPDSLKNNGLSLEENCEIVAEHEMIHLRHANENQRQGNNLGANTAAPSFSPLNIAATINGLLTSLTNAPKAKLGITVTRLERAKTFAAPRLQYILDTWNARQKNSEAPAVMRELNRYFSKVIKSDDGQEWNTLTTRVAQLDKECSDLIGSVKTEKGLLSSLFG